MNRRCYIVIVMAAILPDAALSMAQPVGTSFTYQGRLKQSGLPANSPVDLQFSLYDSAGTGSPPTGGSQVGLAIPLTNVPVVDGLFTVSLDFGAVFNGAQRYLQIGVRPGGSAGIYTALNARQPITGVPYAQWADLGPGGGGDGSCEPRIEVNGTNTPGDANSKLRITQPGSYYLAGNINGESGKHGIEIISHSVTLDLNGFSLLGVSGSLNGINMVNFQSNVVIKNGQVLGWGGSGINGKILMGRIEGITVSFNGAWGIDNLGSGTGTFTSHVVSCEAMLNSTGGIRGSEQSASIERCICNQNGTGISVGDSSRVIDCVATTNSTGDGISTGDGCSITGCTTQFSFGNGISTGGGCTVSGCTAASNNGDGMLLGAGCAIDKCTLSSNTVGISAGLGCTISVCTATSNDDVGISAGAGSTITSCTTTDNDMGILVSVGTVTGCTVRNNSGDGIQAGSRSRVINNSCASNGLGTTGAGIHITGSDNSIESNNCFGAHEGIRVDQPGNIIVHNTCSGNATNWEIVANNVYGAIIDRRSPASAAVSGNSGVGSLGTTDPNANFTY